MKLYQFAKRIAFDHRFEAVMVVLLEIMAGACVVGIFRLLMVAR